MLHIAKSIFKQNLIAKQIFSDLFTDDADFSDDQVKLDVGLFVKQPAHLHKFFEKLFYPNAGAFIEKNGNKFIIHKITATGQISDDKIDKQFNMHSLAKLLSTIASEFGAGSAKISIILKKLRQLTEKKVEVTQQFVDDLKNRIDGFINIINNGILQLDSIQSVTAKLEQISNAISMISFTSEKKEETLKGVKDILITTGLFTKGDFQIDTEKIMTNVFDKIINPRIHNFKHFVQYYSNLSEFHQKIVDMIDNSKQLSQLIKQIKKFVNNYQGIDADLKKKMLESIENVVDNSKNSGLTKLLWWFENPYTLQEKNTVNDYVNKRKDPSDDHMKAYEYMQQFYIGDKENFTKEKQKIQTLMNFLSNNNTSSTGHTIEYIKDIINLLSKDQYISHDVLLKRVFDDIIMLCDGVDKLGFERISLLKIMKLLAYNKINEVLEDGQHKDDILDQLLIKNNWRSVLNIIDSQLNEHEANEIKKEVDNYKKQFLKAYEKLKSLKMDEQ